MNIAIENKSAVAAQAVVTIEKNDYEKDAIKGIKNFCAKAQVPGFRQGKVPFGMGKKMYGTQAKMDAVNASVSKAVEEIMSRKDLKILGQPVPAQRENPIDIENEEQFELIFDLALIPEFNIELTADDKIPYYDITVSEDMINKKIAELQNQCGHSENVEEAAEDDILRGTLAELSEEGTPKENGLVVETVSIMPKYISNEDQKALFANAKVNDVITFTPSKAYGENELSSILKVKKEELSAYQGNFSFQVTEISRYVQAELNQEFFDMVAEKDTIHNEEELKAHVKEVIQKGLEEDSKYRFFVDLQKYTIAKVGKLDFDRDILRNMIVMMNDKKAEKEITDEELDYNIESLTWDLISSKLFEAKDLKITADDQKKMARQIAKFQFAQYGIQNAPEDYISNYAESLLKKEDSIQQITSACVREKLGNTYKDVVTLEHKPCTQEEFNKLFEEDKNK